MSSFRWPISSVGLIRASSTDVWAAISMPGNLELAHPFCAANPVFAWPGPESRDEVHYLNGVVYERRFTGWIESVGYDLDIGAPGEATSAVSWRVEHAGPVASRLRITVCPHLFQGLPTPVRWFPHITYLRPLLQRYLSSVIRGFEWYATRGEPVPRNQFGPHPWFSPEERHG